MAETFNRLYIHVPFCQQKCDYCAFYSEPAPKQEAITAYLACLKQELTAQAEQCANLSSIYIGGGTPSLLSPKQLTRLFESITANFAISSSAEISIECNPESLDREKASVIANFANRVSVGLQSFNCKFRRIIGRVGEVESFAKALDLLISHGVKNIGCDLIYGIPGETIADWEQELQQAVKLPIQHLSAYSLTYEEGSKLYQGKNVISSEEHIENEASMWELTGQFLAENELKRYEISNFAREGYRCRHNEEIWYGDAYLGCGPTAASFDGTDRWSNPATLTEWLAGNQIVMDRISPEKRAREIFAMGLRTSDGWQSEQYQEKTGFDYRKWLPELQAVIDNGLMVVTENQGTLTNQGLLLWNEIAETLL